MSCTDPAEWVKSASPHKTPSNSDCCLSVFPEAIQVHPTSIRNFSQAPTSVFSELVQ
jgi:hypothetical protein